MIPSPRGSGQTVAPTRTDRDVESQYDYFGARYYDARIGRWLGVDPFAGDYPELSPFAFVANNPVLLTDPNGMELHTSGDSSGVHSVLGYVSGLSDKEFASRYRNSKGVVSFDFSGLDRDKNEGLRLLNDLIESKDVYLFALQQVDDAIKREMVLSSFGR
jgi:RHS repeat-associated protein